MTTQTPPATSSADEATIAAYAREAEAYALKESRGRGLKFLEAIEAELPVGGRVLDVGCGGGWASKRLADLGFDVDAIDACPELAAIASRGLPKPARVLSFDEIEEVSVYDGIIALASLHHAAREHLPAVLARLARALKPGGVLLATVKGGDGEERDALGRFYAYYSLEAFRAAIDATPGLTCIRHLEARGTDYTGKVNDVYGILARRTD